jgi:SPW repeat
MDDWSSAKLCDVVNLLASVVLFFSPWLFDLSTGAQWQTASIVGIIIAVLSIAAIAAFAAFAVWEEWLNLIVGLALIVSPWLLGFQDSAAMAIDVVIGIIVAALAALEVWLSRPMHETRGGTTASR